MNVKPIIYLFLSLNLMLGVLQIAGMDVGVLDTDSNLDGFVENVSQKNTELIGNDPNVPGQTELGFFQILTWVKSGLSILGKALFGFTWFLKSAFGGNSVVNFVANGLNVMLGVAYFWLIIEFLRGFKS